MNNINLPIWKLAFDVIQTAFVTGITIYVWILNKHKVNASKIAALEEKHSSELNQVKNRLIEIETTIKHMPDKRSIHNIHERLNSQSELLKRVEGEMKGLQDTSALILQALINKNNGEPK